MNILLTGASGFIGSHLLRELVARGHHVRACVRQPKSMAAFYSGAEYIHCDFSSDTCPELWRDRMNGIDIVINAVGIIREAGNQYFNALHRDTPIALFQAAADAGVRRIIQISALGADDTARSRYHRSKRAADDFLAGLPLEWIVLRPSVVYGSGAKSMAMFRALAALPLTPLVADGQQLLQPIHIVDLIRVVLHCIDHSDSINRRIDLVGPTPITLKALLAHQRHWLGLGAMRSISMPYSLSLKFATLAGIASNAPIDRESVEMLQQGNTGDASILTEQFHFAPRAIEDVLAATPVTTADRWQAGLYFLRPLLRISIALIWILAGLTSAFFYPVTESYALLAQSGVTGPLAPVVLYGAAMLDFLLGVALLFSFHLRMVAWAQIGLVVIYSLIITFSIPELWLHPFGPVSKNLPLLVATLVMLVLERE